MRNPQDSGRLPHDREPRSNEIRAVPELLDQLALENSIVTLDAMGCQTAIAEHILARGGDYLLTLKGNHPLAHAAVVKHFDQRCFRVGATSRADCDAFDGTHGRLVRRRVFCQHRCGSPPSPKRLAGPAHRAGG